MIDSVNIKSIRFFFHSFFFFATIMIVFFLAFTVSARDTVKETIANLGCKKRYIWKILKQHNQFFTTIKKKWKLRACLHEGGGPKVGEVTRLGGVILLST